jgi:hypothetical protein
MIPANGAPHDLEARDALRSLSFAQRRAGADDNPCSQTVDIDSQST